MAWHQRGNRKYYYHSVRVAGWPTPVRRYVGAGLAAELEAAGADLRRLKREVAARELAALEARLREAEAPLLALCDLTDVLARAVLLAAGFYQHDRGEWRRRHGGASRAEDPGRS
jgi:hypothetical protein